MTRAVFFDVANTLLEKPDLFTRIQKVLKAHGVDVQTDELRTKHKLLSEWILFPDKTSASFYRSFNTELLYSLGVIPHEKLLDDIFQACTYLEWRPFEDTTALDDITVPMGIISNWDTSLNEKLGLHFHHSFRWVLGSGMEGVRKPAIEFYQRMIDLTDLDPSEIMYVGDSVKLDIEPAITCGIRAVLIDRLNVFTASGLHRIQTLHELKNIL